MNSFVLDYERSEYANLISNTDAKRFLRKICTVLGLSNVSFSVNFISTDTMHKLNLDYRKIDGPTDVLSFAVTDSSDDEPFIVAGDEKTNLGDIFICPEVYRKNAEEFKVTEDEELHRLLIHGVLHLSGMDHKTNDAEEPMLKLQEDILSQIF